MKRIGYVCTNPENSEYTAFALEDPARLEVSYQSPYDAVGRLIKHNSEFFGLEVIEIGEIKLEPQR